MKNKFWIGLAVLGFMAMSCAAMTMTGEEKYGKSVPVITGAFASKELIPGHTWKVYLKASDPDGDMQYIVSNVYQPGWGDYPLSRTRIREENRKELDGYIYLNTLISRGLRIREFFHLSG